MSFRRKNRIRTFIIMGVSVAFHVSFLSGGLGAVEFGRDVLPIFSEKCFQCHGPDEKNRKADLRLDTMEGATRDLGGYAAVVPGNPGQSTLIDRIEHVDPDEIMPPPDSELFLNAKEKRLLREWIEMGAPFEDHWAFLPPQKLTLPNSGHPMDAIVAARLDREGLSFSPPASAEILCRRLYLDIIGIPPTPTEVDAFVAAEKVNRDQAVKDLSNRLQNSAQFGERWARPWLDVARYADSNGFEKDLAREQWAWRDWVIQAINNDKPYNAFLIEQIAGDLLPDATQDQIIATGFLRNGMVNEEGAIVPEQFRIEGLFDRMDCIGKAVLGLSLQCAQCHSHKFDPITQDEYYGMFAFLNNTHEAQSWVYSKKQLDQIQHIQSKVEDLENKIRSVHPDWKTEITHWEASLQANHPKWQTLDFHEHVWEGGLNHPTQLPDHSILVLGHPTVGGSMYLVARTGETTVTELRLEALQHGDHPFGGPGRGRKGLFSIGELEIYQRASAEADWEKVALKGARADFATEERAISHEAEKEKRSLIGPAAFMIDGNTKTGWMPDRGPVLRHTDSVAVVTLSSPLKLTAESELKIRLQLHQGETADGRDNLQLGRVRCSITDNPPSDAPLPDHAAWLAMEKPIAERTQADFRVIFRAWRNSLEDCSEINTEIVSLEQTYPEAETSVLSLAEPPTDLQRVTYFLDRGGWNRPRHVVEPHVPTALHATHNTPKTRLDFARWLASDASPLTARVQVNRVWQSIFGVGLVETAEDFGTRAPRPEHQALLDWLAVDFMEKGWSLKSLIRTIVSSQVYQQDSKCPPELAERDPQNRLLARGPRFRMDAESIRDTALSISGLLHERIGGASFHPPVPQSMLDYNYFKVDWHEAQAPERYRRSLYMFRKRSMPDPVLTTFDAPNGDFACARRMRSNTPLAALTPLNEPVFVEASRALSLRILKEGGTKDASRADYGFRLCTGRSSTASEREALLSLIEKQRSRLADGWLSIDQIGFGGDDKRTELPEGTTPQDAAAWTIAARVLLNMDATLTKF
jgi:hypothetical protein